MNIVQREDYDRWSKIISVTLHLLLFLLAFYPFFLTIRHEVQDEMVIQFVEIVPEDQEDGVAKSLPTGEATPPSSQNEQAVPSQKTIHPQHSVSSPPSQRVSEVIATNKRENQDETSSKARDFGALFGNQNTSKGGKEANSKDLSQMSTIGTVTGQVGLGLSGRRVTFAPKIEDNSQKTGRVIVSICVDAQGKVSSAHYTQRGSTTNDQYLTKKAEESAKKWTFSPSDQPKQCGVITIDFKVE